MRPRCAALLAIVVLLLFCTGCNMPDIIDEINDVTKKSRDPWYPKDCIYLTIIYCGFHPDEDCIEMMNYPSYETCPELFDLFNRIGRCWKDDIENDPYTTTNLELYEAVKELCDSIPGYNIFVMPTL